MGEQSLIEGVERYYTAKLAEHGAKAEGVDWNGEYGQRLRYEQLLAVVDDPGEQLSINDFGCGYGALVEHLASSFTDFSYVGYDISPAMIAAAREIHRDEPRAKFVHEERELRSADFTLASGIFNVRLDQPQDVWAQYVLETIDRIASVSRRGLAFNFLTSHSDPERMRPDLHYADPSELLDYCLRHYSRDVVVKHDYGLYEFTVLVWLDRRPPVAGAATPDTDARVA
jgi:SAM-dependent methyltransferase